MYTHYLATLLVLHLYLYAVKSISKLLPVLCAHLVISTVTV